MNLVLRRALFLGGTAAGLAYFVGLPSQRTRRRQFFRSGFALPLVPSSEVWLLLFGRSRPALRALLNEYEALGIDHVQLLADGRLLLRFDNAGDHDSLSGVTVARISTKTLNLLSPSLGRRAITGVQLTTAGATSN